jgi:hypothetical protein
MNGYIGMIALELAYQRMDAFQREVAKARPGRATSSSASATRTAGRIVRSALARPLALLSVWR